MVYSMSMHYHIHLCNTLATKSHHSLQLFSLMLSECFVCLMFAFYYLSQLIAGITNRFQLTNLTHHHSNLMLCLATEVVIADMLQVLGNFQFCLVSSLLFLFYLPEEFCKLLITIFYKQLAHHIKHLSYPVSKGSRFFLCLKDCDFWCLYQT